jgi:8-oxo-dGTP pyrophosphatase MutT (NUDIX family)
MAVTPRPAATVILLRETHANRFEVFLLKRHQKSVFMGGNYVYPGGTVDKADLRGEIASCCGLFDSQSDLFGYRIAAIRELFEEAGVLLARDSEGNLFRPSSGPERARFSGYREQLHKGEVTLPELSRREQLLFDPAQLYSYAHWITPEANPVRFDTRFFVACHPAGQEASPDFKETTDGVWISAREALEKNIEGAVPLSPPTLKTLEDVARFDTVTRFLDSLAGAEKKPMVLPVAVKVCEESVLIYPWDPEYEAYRMGKADETSPHGTISTPADNTTRLVFRQGRWLPYVKKS